MQLCCLQDDNARLAQRLEAASACVEALQRELAILQQVCGRRSFFVFVFLCSLQLLVHGSVMTPRSLCCMLPLIIVCCAMHPHSYLCFTDRCMTKPRTGSKPRQVQRRLPCSVPLRCVMYYVCVVCRSDVCVSRVRIVLCVSKQRRLLCSVPLRCVCYMLCKKGCGCGCLFP